jgi:hypothetical protein
MSHEHVARVALVLAGTPADEQTRILAQLHHRLDRGAAIQRRDTWIREAFKLIGAAPGSVRILSQALAGYHRNTWPCRRYQADPPPHESPLRQAFFRACQACDDANCQIPGERQIRRIVC